MRRNRLVVLIGFFLAVVAFALIVVTLNQNAEQKTIVPPAPTTEKVVIAAGDIPLGTRITDVDVTTKEILIKDKPAGSYGDVSLVIGLTARMQVTAQQIITTDVFNGASGSIGNIEVPAGFVAISVPVDQITGVGTIIKAGDHVDVVTGLTSGGKVPVVQWQTNIPPSSYVKVPEDTYNTTTVKTLVQGLQVLGTLLPPPTAAGATNSGAAASPGVTLNNQSEIVILAVTAQDAEIIKFAEMDGAITLVLRSAADCQNADGTPAPCAPTTTSGITLRILVDGYGVVPPQVVEIIQPSHMANPNPAHGAPNR